MCYGCWEEDGSPQIRSTEVLTASAGFSELDSAGPLHVVVDDWNLDDEVLDLVARDYELQPEEAEFVALLKRMPYDQRLSAAALSSQFWAY